MCAISDSGPQRHGQTGQMTHSGVGFFSFLSIDSIVVFIANNVAHNVLLKLRSVPAS